MDGNILLPEGFQQVSLKKNADERGCLTEFFRAAWFTSVQPIQWNVVISQAKSLRGVHLHFSHVDYLTIIDGELLLGLHDLRPQSSTCGLSVLLPLTGNQPEVVVIPIGVAHGFYFPVKTAFIYGLTQYWNPNDELGCRWDDPELNLDWPITAPILSERDKNAPSLQSLREIYLARTQGKTA